MPGLLAVLRDLSPLPYPQSLDTPVVTDHDRVVFTVDR